MIKKRVSFFSAFMFVLLLSFGAYAQQQSSSIWDERSDDSRYFQRQNTQTGADIRAQFGKKEAKKSTFKRQVYTGPTVEEIAAAANKKAQENFQRFLPKGNYDVRFEAIAYNPTTDTLSISKLLVAPKPNTQEARKFPFYLKADSMEVSEFNIGQKLDTPLKEEGVVRIRKIEIPVYNEKDVKSGKMDFAQLIIRGPFLKVMNEGAGKLNRVDVSDFRSEKIMNETVLNNIIRSKVFSANNAVFNNVTVANGFLKNLGEQSLTGIDFTGAIVNNEQLSSKEAAEAAMISYSARVLNPDLVLGARLEAQKKQPVMSMSRIKENAEKNKQEKNALISETDSSVAVP